MLGIALCLTGCGKVHLSTGFTKGTFAKIDGSKVDMNRAKLLLSELKYSYEKLFNSDVWKEQMGDVTAEEYVKNSVKDTVTNLEYLKMMADDKGIELTREELAQVEDATEKYIAGLSYADSDTKAVVMDFYSDLLIGEKVFYAVTDGIDTRVSVDEARVISVQYIFFSTTETDENGTYVSVSESARNRQLKKATQVLEQINDGADFASMAKENSDDNINQLQFGRGEYSQQFEDAAFSLDMGVVSDVITTPEGYYIIKCTNDNVDSDYDKRKDIVITARRKKAFATYYQDFVKNITCEYNDYFWDDMPMDGIDSGNGQLYDIYNKIISTQSN